MAILLCWRTQGHSTNASKNSSGVSGVLVVGGSRACAVIRVVICSNEKTTTRSPGSSSAILAEDDCQLAIWMVIQSTPDKNPHPAACDTPPCQTLSGAITSLRHRDLRLSFPGPSPHCR